MKKKSLFIACEYNTVIDCISMEASWVFGPKAETFLFEIINCSKLQINNCCLIPFITYNMTYSMKEQVKHVSLHFSLSNNILTRFDEY